MADDYTDWCWKRIAIRMAPKEKEQTRLAFHAANRFFETTKYGSDYNVTLGEILKEDIKEYRVNGALDMGDDKIYNVLKYMKGGKLLLAKSAPCVCFDYNADLSCVTEKGFFLLCQEEEKQHLVFVNSNHNKPFLLTPNCWVYQKHDKLMVNTDGEYSTVICQFASEGNASYFKTCLQKLNFGHYGLTEIFGPTPIEQLRCRGILKSSDEKLAKFLIQLFSILPKLRCSKPIPDEQFPSPWTQLGHCVLEKHWVNPLAKHLDYLAYCSVAVKMEENVNAQKRLLDLEKDVNTMTSLLPFCSCDEKTHEPVADIEKKLREMGITIKAVKTLQELSQLYNTFKEKLSAVALDVQEKVNILAQYTQPLKSPPLHSPANRNLYEIFKKLKQVPNMMKKNGKAAKLQGVMPKGVLEFVDTKPYVKKNVKHAKLQGHLSKEVQVLLDLKPLKGKNSKFAKIQGKSSKGSKGVLEFVDPKPIVYVVGKVLRYLNELYCKAVEGKEKVTSEDFAAFDAIDQCLRAGRDSAFELFKSQFTKEVDQCTKAISSFFETGKAVFGEPTVVIIRDGEQFLVDELTETKSLDKVTYICCALLGLIKQKSYDLIELSSLFTDSIIRFLDFDTTEWSELVEIVQMLRKFAESQNIDDASTSKSSSIDGLSDFEVIPQMSLEVAKLAISAETDIIRESSSVFSLFDHGTCRQFAADEFKERRSLAGGGYGAVTLEKHPDYYAKLVIKIFHYDVEDKYVIKELENIKRLQCNTHIVNLIGFLYDNKDDFKRIPIGYVMEHIQLSLYDVIHKRREVSQEFYHEYTILKALQMVEAMASAFADIHALKYMHLDIKPNNILVDLVDSNMVIKVCDLGTLGVQSVNQTGSIGTYQYMSPQMMGGMKPGWETDVYSLAITIWELFHRRIPYNNATYNQVWDLIKEGQRPEVTSTAFRLVNELVTKAWSQKPEERPTMARIQETAKNMIKGLENLEDLAMTQIR